MSTLTITRTVTYTDPDSSTPYTLTATKTLDVSVSYRKRYELSPSTSTKITAHTLPPFATSKLAYIYIFNSGSNSAYIAIHDGTNDPTQHEIPAGADLDLFGKDIWGAVISSSDELLSIYAKGDTSIEVDLFM